MTLKTDAYQIGLDSTTDTNNFLLQTNGAGNLHIHKGSSGTGPVVIRVKSDNTVEFPSQPASAFSCIRLHTANGYGSTNTYIRRFATTVLNQGTDITYADSATLGASFTINTSGNYAIGYSDVFAASTYFGLTLNSSQLTTAIQSVTAADRLIMSTTVGAQLPASLPCTVYLAAGSIIRPHVDIAGGVSSAPERASFTITKVA